MASITDSSTLLSLFENRDFKHLISNTHRILNNPYVLALYSDTDQKIMRHLLRAKEACKTLSFQESLLISFAKDSLHDIQETLYRIDSLTRHLKNIVHEIERYPQEKLTNEEKEIASHCSIAAALTQEMKVDKALIISLKEDDLAKIHKLILKLLQHPTQISFSHETNKNQENSSSLSLNEISFRAEIIYSNPILYSLYSHKDRENILLLRSSSLSSLEQIEPYPEIMETVSKIVSGDHYFQTLIETVSSLASSSLLQSFSMQEISILRHFSKIGFYKKQGNDWFNSCIQAVGKDQPEEIRKTLIKMSQLLTSSLNVNAHSQQQTPEAWKTFCSYFKESNHLQNPTTSSSPIAQKFPGISSQIRSSKSSTLSLNEWNQARSIAQNEIIPGILFLGSYEALHDARTTNSSGIKRVVTVTRRDENLPKNPQLKEIQVHVEDNSDAWEQLVRKSSYSSENPYLRPSDWFDKVFDFIDKGILKGEPVLIHCSEGISRSATLLIAYLMHHFAVPYDKTLYFVQSKRPIVRPNEGFQKGLQKYQAALKIQ